MFSLLTCVVVVVVEVERGCDEDTGCKGGDDAESADARGTKHREHEEDDEVHEIHKHTAEKNGCLTAAALD